MDEYRTVAVVDRSTWGTSAPYPMIRTVTVRWVCPVCGGPRGEPWQQQFYDNGDSHVVDRWTNTCGHLDKYEDVLKEAAAGQGIGPHGNCSERWE